MKHTARAMTLVAGGIGLLSVLAWAQDHRDQAADLQRLVRDQRTIKARLEKIQSKMGRLAEKLAGEGKTYNAGLLTQALEQVDRLGIDDRIDEVIPDMSSARFSTVERQHEILRNLETVYSVLLDRNDLDKLEQRLEQLMAGIEQIKDLRKAEREIVEETARLSESEQALLQRALDQAADLRRQQEQLQERTRSAAERSGERLEQLKQSLDELAARQKSALERSDAAIQELVGTALERLDEAIAAERSALSRLPEEVEAGQNADLEGRDQAAPKIPKMGAETRDAFLADQQRAALALERLGQETLEPGPGRPEASAPQLEAREQIRPAVEAAREAIEEARAAAHNEDTQGSREASRQALAALEQARGLLSQQLEQNPASVPEGGRQEQQSIAEGATEISSALRKLAASEPEDPSGGVQSGAQGRAQKEALREAAKNSQSAAEAARQADQAQGEQKPIEAREASQRALDALNRARSDLEQQAASAREESDRLAARQNYIEGGMSELEQTLSKLAGMSGEQPESRQSSQQQQGLAGQAKQKMGEASESLQKSELEQASRQGQDAADRLAELEESLERSAQETEQKSSQQLAMEQQRYSDLARRQEQLEDRTRDLMNRLKDLNDREQQEALDSAASRMGQASNELSENQGEQALPREKEAEKHLAQAQKEMEEEEEKYQNLRQEELLFKVREELIALRDDSAEVYRKTGEIEAARVAKGRLSRSGRSKVKSLAAETRTIRNRNEEVVQKISQDGAMVFSFTLDQNSQDLERLAGMLGSRPYLTDEFTQSVQLEVVERYDDLIAVMKDELDRRRQATPEESDPSQGDQEGGQQSLIPQVAELLMVKRMEEAAMARVDVFIRTHPELGAEGLDEISRGRLVRMGHQHAEVSALFRRLVGADEESEAGDPENPHEPDKSESDHEEDDR